MLSWNTISKYNAKTRRHANTTDIQQLLCFWKINLMTEVRL
jgi:hypothetical protein